MRRHDRHGSGKTHVYYSNFHPIEADIGMPEPTAMIERIGQKHLLVQSITTCAAEMMKSDGTDRRAGIVVELEGRFNRTEREGTQSAVLSVEAAVILYKNLEHSLGVLMDMGEL
jgi:hypothetical protein